MVDEDEVIRRMEQEIKRQQKSEEALAKRAAEYAKDARDGGRER